MGGPYIKWSASSIRHRSSFIPTMMATRIHRSSQHVHANLRGYTAGHNDKYLIRQHKRLATIPRLSNFYSTTTTLEPLTQPYLDMFCRPLSQTVPSTFLARSTSLVRPTPPRTPKFSRFNKPRLAVLRPLSYSTPHRHGAHERSAPYEPASPAQAASPAAPQSSHVAFETQEPRLSLTFTCTVADCGTRSTHEFTKRSYQKGIVIVQCPGCENRWVVFPRLAGSCR